MIRLGKYNPGGGGGTRYILGWRGAAPPLIPWPCLWQKSLIFLPCLRQNSDLTQNHTLCKTIIKYWNSFLFNPLAITKLFKKIPCLRQKLIKSIPWLRQKMIKSIPCLRQKSRKTYPGWPHVPIKPLWGSTPWNTIKNTFYCLKLMFSNKEKTIKLS